MVKAQYSENEILEVEIMKVTVIRAGREEMSLGGRGICGLP
jgi:hypothetical protein